MAPRSRPPAKTRAEAKEISATDAAKRLGLTKQAIGLWCTKPGAPVRKDGTRVYVRWPDFARWREQELTAGEKKSPETATLDMRRQEADTSTAESKAEREALALARERGELVHVDDYAAAVGSILDRLTARLRALPLLLSHMGTEVETAAEQEVERVITELHAWDEDVADESDGEQPAAAEPAA